MKFIRVIKAEKTNEEDLLENNDAYDLIYDGEIKENTEIFDRAIKEILRGRTEYDMYNGNGSAASDLLCEKIIKPSSKYFEPLLKKAIKNYAVELLMNKVVTKGSPYYDEVVKMKEQKLPSQIRYYEDAYMLLKNKVITKNHPLYEKAIKKVLKNTVDDEKLVKDGIFKNYVQVQDLREKYNISKW